jgi:hypothetical protein
VRIGAMSRDAADLHEGWAAAARDYGDLWNSLHRADAETRYRQVFDRAEILAKAGTKFPNKKKRLNYWLDHAPTFARTRYA